jgi:hypothetical protein
MLYTCPECGAKFVCKKIDADGNWTPCPNACQHCGKHECDCEEKENTEKEEAHV